jgi:plastocyanin
LLLSTLTSAKTYLTMTTLTPKNKRIALLCAISLLNLSFFALAGETKNGEETIPAQNKIEIKDFTFNPQILTVRSGEKITWINRDEEPHTVVSVEKQFKKSTALDTDQEFTITAGAPGTYTYFCSVHPKMTGTIVVVKS